MTNHETVHFTPANCMLENAASVDADALKKLSEISFSEWHDNPEIDKTVVCSNCPAAANGEPKEINVFMIDDPNNRKCLEDCPFKIPENTKNEGIGTFSEWPENSHFFGG